LAVLTRAQLGVHAKPCGVLNVAGYFDPLLALLDRAVVEGFLKPEHRQMLLVGTAAARLLDIFDAYKPPAVEKWIDRSRT
jgi:predicted Rossmann-fold nucleotide-binding protein